MTEKAPQTPESGKSASRSILINRTIQLLGLLGIAKSAYVGYIASLVGFTSPFWGIVAPLFSVAVFGYLIYQSQRKINSIKPSQ